MLNPTQPDHRTIGVSRRKPASYEIVVAVTKKSTFHLKTTFKFAIIVGSGRLIGST